MNWEALGAIGETLGAIAVFITLVYLAVQVRHARREAQRAIGQSRGEALRDLFSQGVDDRINRLRVKANSQLGAPPSRLVATLMERVGMTREDATLLVQYQFSFWNYVLQIIPHADDMSEVERHHFDLTLKGRYGGVGVDRLLYESNRDAAHPNIVRYIEGVLAQRR